MPELDVYKRQTHYCDYDFGMLILKCCILLTRCRIDRSVQKQTTISTDPVSYTHLKDYRLVFKGSRNQRIIDVQKSLQSGSVILSEKDEQNQKLKEEDMVNA